jgi:hypothetical protein
MGQHTIPQRYQSNFHDPSNPGFIWLHDKSDGPPPRLVPIKAALQAKEFYPSQTEKALADDIEKPGNNAIEKLINEIPIDVQERIDLSRYAFTMSMRVPAFRRWADGLVFDSMSEVISRGRQFVRDAEASGKCDPELISRRYWVFDEIEQRYSVRMPQWAFDRGMVKSCVWGFLRRRASP